MTIYQLRATLAEEVVLLQESNTETDERMFMVLLRRLSRDNYIEWKWSDDIWDIKTNPFRSPTVGSLSMGLHHISILVFEMERQDSTKTGCRHMEQ